MIPLILRLENFMSYASLDLDLRGVHSAVLTGPNGAGKSSLLDALTYALWDKGRAPGEQLIRLGASELWVELVFEAEGQIYRVWRRRLRKTGTQSQLEFHQLAPGAGLDDAGAWVPLTGTTIRETQSKILAVVHMDHETFVNSAFLRQGRADEFTTKTPRERKAVLAEILGLHRYDALASRARDRWKQAQSLADDLEAEQAGLRDRLQARPAVAADREATAARLAALEHQLVTARATHAERLAASEVLRGAEARAAELASAADAHAGELARLEAALASHEAAMAKETAALADREAIETAHAEWERLGAEERAQREAATAYLALAEEVASARSALLAARHQHELALRDLDARGLDLEKELKSLESTLADRSRVETAFDRLKAARLAETRLLEKVQSALMLEREREAIAREVDRLRLDAEVDRQARRDRLARARADADRLAGVSALADDLEARLQVLNRRQVEQDRLREKGIQHRMARDFAQQRAAAARQTALAQRQKLEALVAVKPGGRGPAEAGVEALLRYLQDEAAGHEAEAERLDDEAARLDTALDETRDRYAALSESLKSRIDLAMQVGELRALSRLLDEARQTIATIEAELAAEAEPAWPEPLRRRHAEVEAALAELAYDPAELAVVQAQIQDNRWAEARHYQLEGALATHARLLERLPALESDRAALEAHWAREEATRSSALAELETARADLGYDPEAHRSLQARLAALEAAPRDYTALQKRLLWLEGAAQTREHLMRDRDRTAAEARAVEREREAIARALAGAAAQRQALEDAEAAVAALRDAEREALAERARLDAALAELDRQAERLEAAASSWKAAVEDAGAYKTLTAAFGKDGIQAAIIENAIPEIEEEANRLLARMTDNRMHVRLATQREKKTGGVNETLEIVIADEVGTRHYELYSGGEAFRVDFALRLALSRLLARRSGAPLKTLVIDEGFGTQDEKGRERLVEAIASVSGEFARILVVTHIKELKDAFNTQIEVTKQGGVSQVHLVS